MKEGDIVTEEQLKEEGFKHIMHLSSGVHAWESDTHWIAYERATGYIMVYKERAKFTYP